MITMNTFTVDLDELTRKLNPPHYTADMRRCFCENCLSSKRATLVAALKAAIADLETPLIGALNG